MASFSQPGAITSRSHLAVGIDRVARRLVKMYQERIGAHDVIIVVIIAVTALAAKRGTFHLQFTNPKTVQNDSHLHLQKSKRHTVDAISLPLSTVYNYNTPFASNTALVRSKHQAHIPDPALSLHIANRECRVAHQQRGSFHKIDPHFFEIKQQVMSKEPTKYSKITGSPTQAAPGLGVGLVTAAAVIVPAADVIVQARGCARAHCV
jgi:hypothetical protein